MSHIVAIGEYQINKQRLIGKGQYGLVYECSYRNDIICAKILDRALIEQKYLDREIKILNQMKKTPIQNPNLVYIYEVIDDPQSKDIYMFMEYCEGGDLKAEMLQKRKAKTWYTVQESINIIAQIVKGYKFLFDYGFVHRDIKPANVLIQNGFYKLSDFGLGKQLGGDQNTQVGTPSYSAPQIFFAPIYTNKADIYSFGVIFYELLYKELPIKATKNAELLAQLRAKANNEIKCPELENVNGNVITLIEHMLRYSESDRISWEDLFNHPLFNNNTQIIAKLNPHNRRNSLQNIYSASGRKQFQQRQQYIYYHFQMQSYTQEDKPEGIQALKHFLEILMTKGDLAYNLIDLFSQLDDLIIDNDSLSILEFCLIAYKYFISLNVMGICTNQQQYLFSDDFKYFNNLNQLMEEYSNSKDEDIVEMKTIIHSSLGYINRYYRDLQQVVLRCLQQKQQFQNLKEFQDCIEDEDNQNYQTYFKWFQHFQNILFKNRHPNLRLQETLNKMLSIEITFPQNQFYLFSSSQILRIKKQSTC